MLLQIGRKFRKVFLFNDLRGVTIILLGACIYLFLFSVFGQPEISSIAREPSRAFPRKLWQSWKTDAASFDEKMAQRVRSWTNENPTFRYEVLTDSNSLAYVTQTYGPEGFNRPDVVSAYKELTATIVKADLLRYLVMYAEGGIYADVDVEAIVHFDDFIPRHLREHDLDMIIGIETDQPEFKNHRLLGVKAQSFCQWTFVCKRRAPAMLRLINNVLHRLNDLKLVQKKEFRDLTFDFDAVLDITGPSAFTTAILAEMSVSTGHTIAWDEFHRLREAKVVDRILVLPAQAFAAATGHSESGSHTAMGALVKHWFGASGWTKEHQRYKHPAYGTVERCNWDPECVKLWDINTAAFDALSEQEQLDFLAEQQKPEKAQAQEVYDQTKKPEVLQAGPEDQKVGDSNKSQPQDNQKSDTVQSTTDNQDKPPTPATISEKLDEPAQVEADAATPSKQESVASTEEEPEYDIPDATTLEAMLAEDKLDIPDVTALERMLMEDT